MRSPFCNILPVAAACASLWTSDASAACKQTMLKGTWYLIIFARNFGSIGDTTARTACTISVSSGGAFSASKCVEPFASENQFKKLPEGHFALDSSCHITGSMTFTQPKISWNVSSFNMWLGRDQGTAAGYGNGSMVDTDGKTYKLDAVPLEMLSETPQSVGPGNP
jgi:hypothetical protein